MSINAAVKLISGRYQSVRLLGRGGMGEVYKAFDLLTRQYIALKRVWIQHGELKDTIPPDLLDRNVALAQEFQALASLRHSHIISVLDYGFDREYQPYFTMELLNNPQTILVASYGQPLAAKIHLLVQTLQAMAYLHRHGILHRDLKPANLLVVNGEIKVVDLSLAWAKTSSSASSVVGTLPYMAPEVLRSQPLTPAVDLYAIGVIAYELIVGRHPFDLSSVSALINDVLETKPDLTPLQGDLSQLDQANFSASSMSIPTIPIPTDIIPDDTKSVDPWQTMELDIAAGQPPTTKDGALADNENSGLATVIGRLLNKSPQERYADANEVIQDLCAAVGLPIPSETTLIRESFLQAARFVGRDAELIKLQNALSEAVHGKGSLWLIGGESGVGKSRLLDEVRIRALVRGTLVLRGQARLNGLVYEVWREPLSRLVLNSRLTEMEISVLKAVIPAIDSLMNRNQDNQPDAFDRTVAPAIDIEQLQKRLLEVMVSLINRQAQPLIIILEDLQWAGSESLLLIEQLSQFINSSSLLILANYRYDELPHLPTTLPNAHVLKLNRLSEKAITELSVSMLGQAGQKPDVLELLQRETEGNVFFLIETVRALAQEAGQLDRIGTATLPKHIFAGGIQQIVRRRLSRIPTGDYPLLQLAAVLGRRIDSAVLHAAEAKFNVEAWLLRCADTGILEIQDEHWRFSHDKIREGILAELDAQLLASLHRRAAVAIEAVYKDTPEQAAVLAEHWKQAGEPGKEQHYAALAGEVALRMSANQEAVVYFQRALVLSSAQPDTLPEKTRALTFSLHLAQAQMYLGLYGEAKDRLYDALVLNASVQQPKQTAEALALLGRVAVHEGAFPEVIHFIERSRRLFSEIGDQQGIATNLIVLGRVAFYQGQYAEASRHLTESLSLFRQLNHPIGTAQALAGLANLAMAQGAHTQAVQYLEESKALYQTAHFRNGIGSTLLTLGWAMQAQGNYAQAVSYLREALTVFREISAPSELATALNNLGYLAMVQHQYPEARNWFEEGLAISRRIGDQWGTANVLANLGHIATVLHEPERARQLFSEAGRRAKTLGAVPLMLEIILGIAKLEAEAGALAYAAELFGLVMAHPALDTNIQAIAGPLLEELRAKLDEPTLSAAFAHGKTQQVESIIDKLFP